VGEAFEQAGLDREDQRGAMALVVGEMIVGPLDGELAHFPRDNDAENTQPVVASVSEASTISSKFLPSTASRRPEIRPSKAARP